MYSWEGFLRSLSEYLHKVYEPLLPPRIVEPSPDPSTTGSGDESGDVGKPPDANAAALEAERLEAEKRLEAEREIEKAFANYFGEGQKNSEGLQPTNNPGMCCFIPYQQK